MKITVKKRKPKPVKIRITDDDVGGPYWLVIWNHYRVSAYFALIPDSVLTEGWLRRLKNAHLKYITEYNVPNEVHDIRMAMFSPTKKGIWTDYASDGDDLVRPLDLKGICHTGQMG